MSKPFKELRERLLRTGVAPRHVRRYVNELSDHLADLRAEEERAGRDRAEAESAALARLGGMESLAKAMIEQRQFQSWSARAPWAVFGLGPLCILAAAWLVALVILWTGWQIFLPEESTPFVGIIDGWAMLYFGVGRLLYFGAPLFIGWFMAVVAIRQRSKTWWPLPGMALIALLASAAQVYASRVSLDASGRVGLGFSVGSSPQQLSAFLSHALVIFMLAALPWSWLVWRDKKSSVA